MTEKTDYRKRLSHLYAPSAKEVTQVEVGPMPFLMIDGQGDPNASQEYADAVEALFALSYAIKFAVKKGPQAIDFSVMPLEGLWWADDMNAFAHDDRSNWLWTMMIMQPEPVTEQIVAQMLDEVVRKKGLKALEGVRFESFDEGLSAQIMHIGPFADEAPTIERVHDFIETSGRRRAGKHHEIYLTDIRRADPAKWKTVIRQPMR